MSDTNNLNTRKICMAFADMVEVYVESCAVKASSRLHRMIVGIEVLNVILISIDFHVLVNITYILVIV